MRIRDKIITAACLTKDGIEWTSLKMKQGKPEPFVQNDLPFPSANEEGTTLATVQLPDEVAGKLEGDITASIRTSELIMRTMEFPSADPTEIESMVGFQIDKISPFPLDQLAVTHEILQETPNGALVLMAAARRECIDAVGETFKQKAIHIHSIDARILGWIHLLNQEGHLEGEGCEVLVVDDDFDFSVVVMHEGVPLAFRSIDTSLKDASRMNELAEEIGYTLITLDTEHNLPDPKAINIWTLSGIPDENIATLAEKTTFEVRAHELSTLPPLSEGIVRRALNKKNHIELIPREWIDHEKNRRLQKRFAVSAAVIGSIWLCTLLALFGVYETRAIAFNKLNERKNALRAEAEVATENRRKLRALKVYTDRSNSSLECLLEATSRLPVGDIDFSSFRYEKSSGVTLRGTAENQDTVNEYFIALAQSDLYERLTDSRNNTRNNRGVTRAEYSVRLLLPDQEDSR